MQQENSLIKTLGTFSIVIGILGSLVAIFQQQISTANEKNAIAIESLNKDMGDISTEFERLSDRLRDHTENTHIHYGGIVELQGQINVLEERVKKCSRHSQTDLP